MRANLRSIGARLTLWYILILTLTLVVLGSITYGLMVYSQSRDMDYALRGIADVLVENTVARNKRYFPAEIDALFRKFFGFSPLERQVDIFDSLGRLERGNPSFSADLPLSQESKERAARGLLTYETLTTPEGYPARVLTAPVMVAGRVVNLVRVSMSLENTYATRRKFLLILAAVFPLSLLFAATGGWLLARRALAPVDQMTTTVQKITGENTSRRLHETDNGDELDRLAKTINAMLCRLDTVIGEMRTFSADASHELQTPLTILRGEMEVALLKPRTDEEYRQVLRSGLEEIERINHLVAGLLLLARADSGVLILDRSPIDLVQLVTKVCLQLANLARKKEIELVGLSGEAHYVMGDSDHLHRLLVNLVENAIKYTPDGGRVFLSLEIIKKDLVLHITDNGIGIDKILQQKIFERFYRIDLARGGKTAGVGLGLSIARSIALAHNGRISLVSSPHKGSTFSLYLPLVEG